MGAVLDAINLILIGDVVCATVRARGGFGPRNQITILYIIRIIFFLTFKGWAVRPGAARQNYRFAYLYNYYKICARARDFLNRKINAVAEFYLWPHSYFSRAAFEFISFGSVDDVFRFVLLLAL